MTKLTNSQKQRYELIELKLLWEGSLRIADLTDTFSISRMQASKDISYYRTLHPNQINDLNRSTFLYTPTEFFKLIYASDNIEDYPHLVRDFTVSTNHEKNNHLATVPVFRRQIISGVPVTVMFAARLEKPISVIYGSSTTPAGSRRILSPSRVVYAANRAHVRAFCHERNQWRDFVLSRFLSAPKILDRYDEEIPADLEWNTHHLIKVKPNPSLSKQGQKLVAGEHGIDPAKGVEVKISAALFNYFLIDNNISLTEPDNPWENPLVIANKNDIKNKW